VPIRAESSALSQYSIRDCGFYVLRLTELLNACHPTASADLIGTICQPWFIWRYLDVQLSTSAIDVIYFRRLRQRFSPTVRARFKHRCDGHKSRHGARSECLKTL
jgi:hypothetical protein